MIIAGGESAGSSRSSVSIAPVASYSYRGNPSNVDKDWTIDDLISHVQANAPPTSKYGQRSPDREAYDAYLANLNYIKQSPPKMGEEAKKDGNIGMDDILDAIFYASAIASIVPWAPFQIGGRIGMSAAMAGRSFQTGNYYQGARYLSNMSREASRDIRRYRASYQTVRKTTRVRR